MAKADQLGGVGEKIGQEKEHPGCRARELGLIPLGTDGQELVLQSDRSAIHGGGCLKLRRPGRQKSGSNMSTMGKRHGKGLIARGVRTHGCATVADPAGGQHGSSAESLRVEMNRLDVC